MSEEMTLTPERCPVCTHTTLNVYRITEPNASEALWFHCKCGVVFQQTKPKQVDITECELKPAKKIHGVRTYIRVIEEIAYGRKFVPVGDVVDEYLTERGWVEVKEENEIPDLIICENWLERELEPLRALKEIYEALPTSGVVYIDTPNTDFIYKSTVQYFMHWRMNENYVLWNERSLQRELERIGFKIVVSRCNASLRYQKSDTVQIVAQKPFF